MKTLPWNDAAILAVTTAHAAHRARNLALDNPKREGMSVEEDEAFMKPLHDAADAADIAVLEACPETMRGFVEKAKYLAELWLGIEVEPGWTYDKMREENAPLDPPLFVATIARDAAAMIESGNADKRTGAEKTLHSHILDMEPPLTQAEGLCAIAETVIEHGNAAAQNELWRVVDQLSEQLEAIRERFRALHEAARGGDPVEGEVQ